MFPRLLLLLTLLVVLAGAWWRWQHLESRPLHADEAVQAWQTWQLLRGEGYRYDPVDRHGPLLYYGAAAWEKLRGGDAGTLTGARARSFVWLAGVATLVLVARGAYRWLGASAALVSTALLAVTPLAVLYHTYFVQEAWLALFTWALLFLLLAWAARPRLMLAVGAGLVAGLMQATKETAVLHFAALAVGAATLVFIRRTGQESPSDEAASPGLSPSLGRYGRHAAAAGAAALLVYALFYSSFGTHPRGIVDGVITYVHQWQRSGDADHAQPFTYYLSLLAPHRRGGVPWGEPALLVFAVGGLVLSGRRAAPPAARAVAATTVSLLLVYSLIPYKTPWLLLTPLIGCTLLAGFGLSALIRLGRWGPVLLAATTLAVVGQSAGQTRLALERYPGDERNPYFYQQAPRSFLSLVERMHELRRAAGREPLVAVVSPDYAWPVPWYLKDFTSVGYFTTPPPALGDYDVLLWDSQLPPPEQWPDADATVELHGLRPNVLLYLVIKPELWRQWEAAR